MAKKKGLIKQASDWVKSKIWGDPKLFFSQDEMKAFGFDPDKQIPKKLMEAVKNSYDSMASFRNQAKDAILEYAGKYGDKGKGQPVPDNRLHYMIKIYTVSYTHLTLPTKRIV